METKKFYERCGRMLKEIKEKRCGIKTACYKTEMPQKYMAILSSILRRYGALERVVNLLDEDIKSKYTCIVLCYEILYGNRREAIRFNKKLIKKVKDVYAGLGLAEVPEKKERETVYLRLNTLKADYSRVSSLSLEETQIPHVYKVLEKVNWSKLKTYQEGYFFIQDLSSCLAAYALQAPRNAVVVDACAAPGNKTTHIAMLMRNTGKIFAVERDLARFKTLREMTEKSGAENIITINDDFLSIVCDGGNKLEEATHILVDPSCSGSGMHPDEEKDESRLKGLMQFQIKMLSRALSFPNVQRVVYSTCSLYEEENETVVFQCLKLHPQFEVVPVLPEWKKRGISGYEFSEKVIRCDASTDTKGFFLACFVKK
ncbi:25S rRNA (cytosine2278-C5)-methyltransferase [Nematocida sp. AWRm77]|nr:25S rRNA (cytosine2278-C5)-methyltransferase [Nematocida sp. AWRm77]